MGFFKKVFKSAGKAVKSVTKSVSKVVKKVTSTVGKVVKKVAKTIVSVGKSVVKGVKSAVKSVGSALGKLGPLASIALMAIPGFQPFAAGLASSLNITSVIGQQMFTGALTGFIVSGGDMKAALMGGAMAGAGTLAGGAIKGFQAGDTLGGITQAATAQSTIQTFSGGMATAKMQWGNFTNNVGKFFSGIGNGDTAVGTEKLANGTQKWASGNVPEGATFEDTVMNAPSELQVKTYEVGEWKGTPESVAKADFAQDVLATQRAAAPQYQWDEALIGDVGYEPTLVSGTGGGYSPVSADDFYGKQVATSAHRLTQAGISPEVIQEQLSMGTTVADQAKLLDELRVSSGIPQEYSYYSQPGTQFSSLDPNKYQAMKNPIYQVADDYNINPFGEQAQQLMEQEYGTMSYSAGNNVVSFDKDMAFYDQSSRSLFQQAGAGGTPTYMTEQAPELPKKDKKPDLNKLGSLFSGERQKASPSFITSVDPGDLAKSSAGQGDASGGILGYAQHVKEQQSLLTSQAEAQAEQYRQKMRRSLA